MKSLQLTPWHIYRLSLSAEAGGYHLRVPELCLFSSTLNHTRMQAGAHQEHEPLFQAAKPI